MRVQLSVELTEDQVAELEWVAEKVGERTVQALMEAIADGRILCRAAKRDWSGVDFTRPVDDIAAEMGVSRSAVFRQRAKVRLASRAEGKLAY